MENTILTSLLLCTVVFKCSAVRQCYKCEAENKEGGKEGSDCFIDPSKNSVSESCDGVCLTKHSRSMLGTGFYDRDVPQAQMRKHSNFRNCFETGMNFARRSPTFYD